jgi:hypothetical protein
MAMVGLAPEDDDGNAAQPEKGKAAAPRTPPPAKPEPTKTPAAPPMPIGFATWYADLEAVADNGRAALEEAWNKSPAPMRKYLTQHHQARWEALKARAPESPA